MDAAHDTTSPQASSNADASSISRPDRPCDTCRRRKSKCVIKPGHAICILCEFHGQSCTFEEQPAPRSKRKATIPVLAADAKRRSISERPRGPNGSIRQTVGDYADLQGDSLLKTTLGLQNHQHATLVGTSSANDSILINLQILGESGNKGYSSFRKVAQKQNLYFKQTLDAESIAYESDVDALDTIESIVSPHGQALINLYFRIVHPSFPILHKKVYLEKYARSHREFIPPLLAAVYVLALKWWDFSSDLAEEEKPDSTELERIAYHTLQASMNRPKLSTIQAGLLLLQDPRCHNVWQLTCQVFALGQDLGLHRDCTTWQIPSWERGLRKRLAWALYMQSTWASLVYGRPLQVSPISHEWTVRSVSSADFPESAADEDDEEGSTEVEKGRTCFSAMISLTKLLAEVLHNLYSTKAEDEADSASDRARFVLTRVKDLQLRLRGWYSELPDNLKLSNNSKVGKLSSVGWIHTSYFATEMTIHRAILHALTSQTDPYLSEVCRTAAQERLKGSIELFNQLKAEHLQAFWYFASSFNFALTGVFAAVCMATSTDQDEADYYQEQLQSYRWRLRVSSKNVNCLEAAVQLLEASVGSMAKKKQRRTSDGTYQTFMAALSPITNTSRPGTTEYVVAGFEELDDTTNHPFFDELSMSYGLQTA